MLEVCGGDQADTEAEFERCQSRRGSGRGRGVGGECGASFGVFRAFVQWEAAVADVEVYKGFDL